MPKAPSNSVLDKVVSLAKRRGFIFASSEIYGGIASIWDYGPTGVELKRNIKHRWWQAFIQARADVVGLDSSILMNPAVWHASGHTRHFSDSLAECPKCNRRQHHENRDSNACPNCGSELGASRQFNLMFETNIGPLADDSSKIYLRPETAQGIFVNFQNVLTATRLKPPFGIGQIGKSFRNEITPGNFTFRTREFEQMEMEYFCHPEQSAQWYAYWLEFSHTWLIGQGLDKDKLRIRHHSADELPHYSTASADLEYRFPWGWGELETVANRGDYDLRAHATGSGKDLTYFDTEHNQRFVPHVVEPAMGADRVALALLIDAYNEEDLDGGTRVVLRFHPAIAPFNVAVLPLSRNQKLIPTATKIYNELLGQLRCQYDDSQSIGRRYRRQDEIGTTLCVTVDFDTVEKDSAVTIRNRDSMHQIRVPIANLKQALTAELDKFK